MLSLSVTILRIGHEKDKKTEDGENNQLVTYHTTIGGLKSWNPYNLPLDCLQLEANNVC